MTLPNSLTRGHVDRRHGVLSVRSVLSLVVAALCASAVLWAPAVRAADQAKSEAARQALANAAADDVLDAFVEAVGGQDVAKQVGSELVSGDLRWKNGKTEMKGTFQLYNKGSAKQLVVQNLPQMGEMRQGYDGENGWSLMPGLPPRSVKGRELANIALMARLHAMNFKALFPQRELIGVENFNRRSAYRLRLSGADAAPLTMWFDRETHFLIGTSLNMEVGGKEYDVVNRYNDYRKVTVGDATIMRPFASEQRIGPVTVMLTVTECTVNGEIADELFVMPDPARPAVTPAVAAPVAPSVTIDQADLPTTTKP